MLSRLQGRDVHGSFLIWLAYIADHVRVEDDRSYSRRPRLHRRRKRGEFVGFGVRSRRMFGLEDAEGNSRRKFTLCGLLVIRSKMRFGLKRRRGCRCHDLCVHHTTAAAVALIRDNRTWSGTPTSRVHHHGFVFSVFLLCTSGGCIHSAFRARWVSIEQVQALSSPRCSRRRGFLRRCPVHIYLANQLVVIASVSCRL